MSTAHYRVSPDLREFDDRLRACRPGGGLDYDPDALLPVLHEYSDHHCIRSIVESICASGECLERCARASVAHPLGFDKFTLIGSPSYQLKLHVWWPSASSRPLEDIHNHRFDFASAVIVGFLQSEVFRMSTTGAPVVRYSEINDVDQGRYEFVEEGFAHVGLSQRYSVGPRSVYFTTAEVLHRVFAPARDLTATLFFKLPHVRRETTVLVDPALPKRSCHVRQVYSTSQVSAKFQEFLRLLRAVT